MFLEFGANGDAAELLSGAAEIAHSPGAGAAYVSVALSAFNEKADFREFCVAALPKLFAAGVFARGDALEALAVFLAPSGSGGFLSVDLPKIGDFTVQVRRFLLVFLFVCVLCCVFVCCPPQLSLSLSLGSLLLPAACG